MQTESLEIHELKHAPNEMERAPISHVKSTLDNVFGLEQWVKLEMETISYELGFIFTPLIVDKIHILQIIAERPELFFTDPLFMLHVSEVCGSNTVADFEHTPVPTSLEMAYAIVDVRRICPGQAFSEEVTEAIAYLLRHEGFSVPVGPFRFIPENLLVKGQTQQDTDAKLLAIERYIKEMDEA